MNYDIVKPNAPMMPTLKNGKKSIQILLSKAPKIDKNPLVPTLYPLLAAHIILTKDRPFTLFGG